MATALQRYQRDLLLYDRVVGHLRTLQRTAFLGHAIAVGEYIVAEFFGGDFAAVHDKAHDKQLSFQDFLAARQEQLTDLDLPPTTLRTYIAAAEVARDLPEHVASKLGLVHLRQLAIVKDVPERKRLAHEAAGMQWTRQQLAVAVQDWRKAQRHGKRKPGPKPRPAVLQAAASARLAVRKLHKLHGAAGHLDEAHRMVLLVELAAMRKALDDMA